jgi:16S rRNA (guanine527-N7)-methyltransferase
MIQVDFQCPSPPLGKIVGVSRETFNLPGESRVFIEPSMAHRTTFRLDAGRTIVDYMPDEPAVESLLEPFGLQLTSGQISQVLVYLDLLMRWNPKINLTSVRDRQAIVTRHFGESLYLSRWERLQGSLLDIGSGAGFPGLALQIAFPNLAAILLEPVAKKRAFLKEVIRACGFKSVEVGPERLEEFVRGTKGMKFGTITARAVGHFEKLVPEAASVLSPHGKICLWIGHQQGIDLERSTDRIGWDPPIAIPLGREREIWVGRLKQNAE